MRGFSDFFSDISWGGMDDTNFFAGQAENNSKM